MPKHHTVYPAEFRRQVGALFRAGRSARELASEFEPSEQTIRRWITQATFPVGDRVLRPQSLPQRFLRVAEATAIGASRA